MKLHACSEKLVAKRVPRTPSLSLRPVVDSSTTSAQHQTRGLREDNDARTGMPIGIPMGAMCVQRFDDSRKFCNSHYLSHFAAFFIDARTKRSVVESFVLIKYVFISDDTISIQSLRDGRRRTALQAAWARRSRPVVVKPGPPKQR